MEKTTDYRANEKLKKRKYPKIRASFSEWKKGRALRIPVMAVAIFILCAAVKLNAMGKQSTSLFAISIVLFMVWYVMKIVTAKTAYASVKGRDSEIVQVSDNNIVYAYRTRMDAAALGQDITIMLTMQKNGIKEIAEKAKPRRLEITGAILRQVCTPEQFLNRHDPAVKIKKGTKEAGTIVLYDYYYRSDAMYEEIKEFLS